MRGSWARPANAHTLQRMAGAHDHCQGQKPRRDTSIALSIKAFLRDDHKNTPLLILQTTFGNFERKRLSPPQGIRGSKIPLSLAPVCKVRQGRRANGGQAKAAEAVTPATYRAPESVCLTPRRIRPALNLFLGRW